MGFVDRVREAENNKNNDDKKYHVEFAKNKTPLPAALSNEAKELLRGAVLEDNTEIPNRSKNLPEYTLVFNKLIVNKNDNNATKFFVKDKDNNKLETIPVIEEKLGIKLTPSVRSAILERNDVKEDREFKAVYELSRTDAEKLFEHGIPVVTYHKESNRDSVVVKDNVTQKNKKVESGRPLEGIRKNAIKEALSVSHSLSV
ncbi:MAG: hypothetical protein R3D71_05015 [Rickettsiales bacterium]